MANRTAYRRGPVPEITYKQAARIFERLDAGEPIKALALDYGVTPQTLSRTINNAERFGRDLWRLPNG